MARARKTKTLATENHPEAAVRLATYNLLRALDAAKSGNTVDMATFIRLAAMFEQDFSIPAKLGRPILG